MGAMVVAAAAAAAGSLPVRGVVLSSSSLEVFRSGPDPLHPVSRGLVRLMPRLRIPLWLDARKISSDESVQQAYANDRRIARTTSLRLIVEYATVCELLRTQARQILVPCLVLHGELDAIAPAQGAQLLFDALPISDKQLVVFPGQRHEVHNERAPARARFIETLAQWLLARA
jgi:alpha-beta hydrolase superfamily lysophospholipase